MPRTDPLSRNFTTQFGVMVPNTNYPPGLDCRVGFMSNGGASDVRTTFVDFTLCSMLLQIISSESIYEYFIEIGFSNGTTSEIPAGITAFTPFYLSTENNAPSVNVSLSPPPAPCCFNKKPSVDRLRSNYTIELSFPEGAHVHQSMFQ
jgi:hypothetical protein